ncbi:MAG: hypothetical protein Q8J97_07550, partial [Flavobacteriaceae bacterium]|nr:hypothetical protein [Flavobacteriaceae bacterium]
MRTSFDDIVSASSSLTATPRSGTEKRLEVDFAQNHKLLSTKDWQRMIDKLSLSVVSENYTDGLLSIICNECVICVTDSRLIILAATQVYLHLAPAAIQKICTKNGLDIQWMSFQRKNTTSVWNQTDKSMAAEFVELKHHFPKGHAFLFGPADKDHYFYFVYDNVRRDEGVVEADVQINVVMYDIARHNAVEHIPTHVVRFGKGFQGTTSLGNGEYEVLRVDEIDGMWCATFETNKTATDYGARVKLL